MSDRLFALKLFMRVARTGSFSRAGRELGLRQSSASRMIATLERELGTALLTRTTRAVVLTEAGGEYLARIEPILEELDEAEHAMRETGELRGKLRVGMPPSVALREVIPRLPTFMERHPHLQIDLVTGDQAPDFIREGIDVALRLGVLRDSTATVQLVGTNPRIIAASPAYLQRAGIPASPADLAGHPIIMGPVGATTGAWSFERDGKTVSFRAEGRLTINLNEGATAAAVAGLGIISTGLWGCRAELASGALVRILEDWRMAPAQVHAVFPAGRAAKRAARVFVDYLIGEFRRVEMDAKNNPG